MTRYRWVDSRKAEGFPVTQACAVAQVSTSAFYDWLAAGRQGPTSYERDEAYPVNAIIDIHRGSGGTYGVPRVSVALRRAGWPVNRKKVERLMRDNHVVGLHQRRGVRTTIPAETVPPVPDLLGRGFDPGQPDVAWCGDITYLRTGEGWLYLASVLDLGSRRLLGYSMAAHMRTELVADALDMAVAARGGPAWVDGVIFHSDRLNSPSTSRPPTSNNSPNSACGNRSGPSLPRSSETPGVSTGFLARGGIGDPCVRVHPFW